ncbi:hypothetical protein PHLGIDRAFT_80310 [Phlebiopsis gigantea 11061_1 CR5-6]|uniref:Uncharacterized protein n=1 Tax=Phlebiopsis gigantea (strain 11061_1 CR5-6) TaxID=745531 RepID=A0A0C3RZ43_PHLG1|nr:hypothetical protein PHLGIDRAFT_80310 [Phlebiopsis gigantea 11061_1 CR5-6]
MPYRPPKSAFGALLWRRRVWLETTTGLSLLEPWEKVLILAIFYFLLLLLITGVYKLLPGQLEAVQYRMVYYFFGQEADKPGVYVQRFVASLLGNSSAREL